MNRTILLVFVFLFTASYIHAQQDQQIVPGFVSESKAVQFEESRGEVVRKDFYKIRLANDWSPDFKITAVMLTDIRTGEKAPYLLVSSFAGNISYTSVIDYDEIPACIEALEYFLSCETKEKPDHDVMVFIRLRDGLELGTNFGTPTGLPTVSTGFMGRWHTVITHRKYLIEPSTTFALKRINQLIEGLKKSKQLLDEKL